MRVLVVEDEAAIARQLSSALTDAGYAVDTAADGEKAEFLGQTERYDPIVLDRRSPVLKVIQQIRDESHRFAITFHRARRTKRHLTSELSGIAGVGPRTRQRLLSHFGSLAKVREASLEQLGEVVNRRQAEVVWKHFKGE